jgi:hypothetical protein
MDEAAVAVMIASISLLWAMPAGYLPRQSK